MQIIYAYMINHEATKRLPIVPAFLRCIRAGQWPKTGSIT
jgi:hypothetical protein